MWHNGLTGKKQDGRVTGVTRGDGTEGGEEGKGEGGERGEEGKLPRTGRDGQDRRLYMSSSRT